MRSAELVYMLSLAVNSFALSTRVTLTTSTGTACMLSCLTMILLLGTLSCDLALPSCAYQDSVASRTLYVADAEKFTWFIDHTMIAPVRIYVPVCVFFGNVVSCTNLRRMLIFALGSQRSTQCSKHERSSLQYHHWQPGASSMLVVAAC
jgi:hypothetical protein